MGARTHRPEGGWTREVLSWAQERSEGLKLSARHAGRLLDAALEARLAMVRASGRFEDVARTVIEALCRHDFREHPGWVGHVICHGCAQVQQARYVDESLSTHCREHGGWAARVQVRPGSDERWTYVEYVCGCERTLEFAEPKSTAGQFISGVRSASTWRFEPDEIEELIGRSSTTSRGVFQVRPSDYATPERGVNDDL